MEKDARRSLGRKEKPSSQSVDFQKVAPPSPLPQDHSFSSHGRWGTGATVRLFVLTAKQGQDRHLSVRAAFHHLIYSAWV